MKLEEIAKGALVSGGEPGKAVSVVSQDQLGDNAITIVYRTDDGSLRDRIKFKNHGFDE